MPKKISIPYVKYTSYGNTFVIIDEVESEWISESEKSLFSIQATNTFFGIGSDAVIFLQPNKNKVLEKINQVNHYWNEIPTNQTAKFILRIFEPDGSESFSCGNGLLCIADHIFSHYGLNKTNILTEIPTDDPQLLMIGTDIQQGNTWTNMGKPRKVTSKMVSPAIITQVDDIIYKINQMDINYCPENSSSEEPCVVISFTGYLIYTGEPHLVIFLEKDFQPERFSKLLFSSHWDQYSYYNARSHISSQLIQFIGMYLNKKQSWFPRGININFVRVIPEFNCIEYRCFERGINTETFACGTGATAISIVSKRLELIQSDHISILPYLCKYLNRNHMLSVHQQGNNFHLLGYPERVCTGNFYYSPPE